jgi:hypothetical protein
MDELREELQKLIDEAKEALADKKLSWAEALSLITGAIAAFLSIARGLGNNTGDTDVREMIITAVSNFYENVIRPKDIPGLPNIIENTVVDPLLGKAIPTLVGLLYDTLTSAFDAADPEVDTPDPLLIMGIKKD